MVGWPLRIRSTTNHASIAAAAAHEGVDERLCGHAVRTERGVPVPLDVVAAPYRELSVPLLEEIDALKAEGADLITVVIGELVPKWYQHGLHNHRALQMKARLLFEPDVAVVSVPHHL